jgi:hypothetical protein
MEQDTTGWNFMKFIMSVFFKNLSRKFKFHDNWTSINTLHKDQCTFWSYFAQFTIEWELLQAKVVEKIKKYIMFILFFSRNITIYELMWKNVVELDVPQMTIWHMHIACWICKASNTHSEYVILIAFPVHYWLHKRASELCYAYIACLVRVCYMIYIFVYRLQCFYLLHLHFAFIYSKFDIFIKIFSVTFWPSNTIRENRHIMHI